MDAEQLALENSEHLATLVKLFEVLEAKYLAHENKTMSKEMELEESIEEVSAERDQIKNELEEGKKQYSEMILKFRKKRFFIKFFSFLPNYSNFGRLIRFLAEIFRFRTIFYFLLSVKSEFFHRDQKITSLELELSNQLSCNHELERTNAELEEQLQELKIKLELNEIAKNRQNDLERSYERIKVDIARVTDERDEYRSLAESLKSHQANTGLMEQSIAIGPIWPSSPSPVPIRSAYGGSASNLMTQSCHPG